MADSAASAVIACSPAQQLTAPGISLPFISSYLSCTIFLGLENSLPTDSQSVCRSGRLPYRSTVASNA